MEKIMEMRKEISGKKVALSSLNKEKTAVGIVDMVIGFVSEGILSSPRVEGIVKDIVTLNERTHGYTKFFFLDEHDENAVEYNSFANHCQKNSREAELIPALRGGATLHNKVTMIPKNSTNGFHAPGFQKWLQENENKIDTFVITGCVTDICVLQFVLTLKGYFNQHNKDKRIIVVKNCVETYDYGTHDADLMNTFALYNMHINGIEIVDCIE